jgi:ABC-type branched-subunit amino acid transport system ATPase component
VSESESAPAVATTTQAAAAPLLELVDVDVFYGRVQALKHVSLTVNQGEIVALIGSNGAGKTTTLHTISGLNRAADGDVRLRGQPINRLGAERIARMGIGHAPEGRRLFARMTVRENLEMGAYARSDTENVRTRAMTAPGRGATSSVCTRCSPGFWSAERSSPGA